MRRRQLEDDIVRVLAIVLLIALLVPARARASVVGANLAVVGEQVVLHVALLLVQVVRGKLAVCHVLLLLLALDE